ncbi:MAG: NADH-quinone oxidoreductase subunit A [Candidatus Micrarchaeaceae archaeon]
MASEYLAIIVFAAIAVLEPLLMLLASKLIRRASKENAVKTGNYESAEESFGTRASLMGEYLHYFPMFLAFEVLIAIMAIWVAAARSIATIVNYDILLLFVAGFIFEMLIILIARFARE